MRAASAGSGYDEHRLHFGHGLRDRGHINRPQSEAHFLVGIRSGRFSTNQHRSARPSTRKGPRLKGLRTASDLTRHVHVI